VEGFVVDIGSLFAPGGHPGGADVLSPVLGADATDPFFNSHAPAARRALAGFRVGAVSDWAVSAPTAAYRALRARLEAEGAFARGGARGYYAAAASRVGAAAALFLAALASRSSAAHVAGAVALGVAWQQLAFVGHDLGHSGVSGARATDALRGLVFGPALTGISFSWWKATHNVHHVATNSATGDPDVQHMPLLAVSEHFFASLWSTFHAKRMGFGACARATVARQHLFFYPLMFFARWNLYFQGVAGLVLGARSRAAAAEAAALAFFFAWVGAAVAAVGRGERSAAGAWAARLLFLLVANGVAGVLHVQIVLSHFSQPTRVGRAPDEGVSFLEAQLAGTMNIALPPSADFVFGGLQFQVEHHLFPRLPADALRGVRPAVRALAAAHGLPYREEGLWAAGAALYASLKRTADAARKLDDADLFGAGLDERLVDALNMRG